MKKDRVERKYFESLLRAYRFDTRKVCSRNRRRFSKHIRDAERWRRKLGIPGKIRSCYGAVQHVAL